MDRKYQEDFVVSSQDVKKTLAGILEQLFSKKLAIEEQLVEIPTDSELEFKLKYVVTEDDGSFTIKVSWDNYVEEKKEDEDDDD